MIRSIARFILMLLGSGLAIGCAPSSDDATLIPGSSPQQVESVVEAVTTDSAMRLDKEERIIYLDSRIPPPQKQRFDIGLGSITIETLHAKSGELTFHYTPEVEGGFTVYECTVPISDKPVEFTIAPDSTPGETSFDLSTCKVIRTGNLHLPP